MVMLGSRLSADGNGSQLLADLAATLERQPGPPARHLFLAGACGAVFGSFLGGSRRAPYRFADDRFADFWALRPAPGQSA